MSDYAKSLEDALRHLLSEVTTRDEKWAEGSAVNRARAVLARRPEGQGPAAPPSIPLAVWFGSMPESNGKANWTAILYADMFSDGFTLERSEYKDRVRYAADRVRFLLGALEKEPFILDYDSKLIEHADDAAYAEWEKAVAASKGRPT
jgi:hypothetical protein